MKPPKMLGETGKGTTFGLVFVRVGPELLEKNVKLTHTAQLWETWTPNERQCIGIILAKPWML